MSRLVTLARSPAGQGLVHRIFRSAGDPLARNENAHRHGGKYQAGAHLHFRLITEPPAGPEP